MPVLLRTVSKELLEVGFTWTLAVEEPFLHGVLAPFSFQMDEIDQKLEVKYKSYIPDFRCSMGRNLCEILGRYAVLEKGKVWHRAQPPCCPWTKGIGGQLPNYLVLHFFLRQDGLPTPLLHSKWTFWGKIIYQVILLYQPTTVFSLSFPWQVLQLNPMLVGWMPTRSSLKPDNAEPKGSTLEEPMHPRKRNFLMPIVSVPCNSRHPWRAQEHASPRDGQRVETLRQVGARERQKLQEGFSWGKSISHTSPCFFQISK